MVATQICICLVFSFCLLGNVNIISAETQADAANADMEAVMLKCNETHPISMDSLAHMNTSGTLKDENDKKAMCFIHCYLNGLGVLDADGKLHKEKTHEIWGPQSEELSLHCSQTRDPNGEDPDPCVRSYQLAKCVMKGILEKPKSG